MKAIKKIAAIILSLVAIATAEAKNITLQGEVNNLPQGTKLLLLEAVGNKLVPKDTLALSSSGKFKTSVAVEKPTLFILQPNLEKAPQVHLMITPSDKSLELNLDYLAEHNFMMVVSSKGSENMTLYQEFNNALHAPLNDYARINAAHTAPGITEADRKALAGELQALQLKQRATIKESVEKHSACLMSAFLVTFFDNDFTTYADLYEKVATDLGTKYADNPFVVNVMQKVAASMKEGSLAPEIAMKDKNGKVRRLSDLKGKVVLIDFWASWCGPCRAELPNVVRLYNKYHDKGFEIYSVSLDKDRDAWLRSIESTGQIWENHVSDLNGWTSSGGRAYGVSSIPHTVLIDRKGRVIAKKLRGEELAVKLQEIFGE